MCFANLTLDLLWLYFWMVYFVFINSIYEPVLQNYFSGLYF